MARKLSALLCASLLCSLVSLTADAADSAVSIEARGAALQRAGKHKQAAEEFRTAASKTAAGADRLWARSGFEFRTAEDFDTAIDAYNHAIALNPKNAVYFRERGQVYIAKDETDKAIADYNAALKLDPRDDALYYRGYAYYHKDDYANALNDLTACTTLWPHNPPNWLLRARVYWGARQYDLALNDYNRLIWMSPTAENYKERGDCHYAFDNTDAALIDYAKAISLDPKNAKLFEGRASIYQAENFWKQALADCAKVIELDPLIACNYAARAETYLDMGDALKALADAEKAIALKPDTCSEHYIVCAESAQALGDHAKIPGLCKAAAERLAKEKESKTIEEENVDLVVQSARIHLLSGEPEKAIAACDEKLKQDKEDDDALKYRARAYASLKQWDKAVADLNTLLESSPDWSSEDYLDRATVLEALGKTPLAEKDRATAASLKGSDKMWTPPPHESAGPEDSTTYMVDLRNRIRRQWHPPKSNQSRRVVVEFKIGHDGKASQTKIAAASGDTATDQAALQSITAASPFLPLPVGAPEMVNISFSFDVNKFGSALPASTASGAATQTAKPGGAKMPAPNPVKDLIDKNKAALVQKDTAAGHLSLAEAYRRAGLIDETRAELQKAIALDPANEPAKKLQGLLDDWKE